MGGDLEPVRPYQTGRAGGQVSTAGDHYLTESGGTFQGQAEIAGEGATQDLVGDLTHLIRAGRVGAGDRMVGLGEPNPGRVLPGHLVG